MISRTQSAQNQTTKSCKAINEKSIVIYILSFLLSIQYVNGTITVPETSRQYPSQPAAFGMYYVEGREYLARLQSLMYQDEYLCDEDKVTENGALIVVPSDGLPVTIMAKKGQCSFETKARLAQLLHPQIKYLVVYNNVPNDDNLITMSAEDPSGIYLGALYISYESGMDMQMQIDVSADVNGTGAKEGIRIYMDSYTNWDDLGWISWIFVLLTCMVSMFLCLSTGYIRANQGNVRVIIVNGTRQYEELLNDEDVSCLSDYEYQESDDEKNVEQDSTASASTPPDVKVAAVVADHEEVEESKPLKSTSPQQQPASSPKFAFDKYSSCSICLEEFTIGETLCKLPCNHYFHPNCIKPWLTERQPTCPLCKANVKREIDARRRRNNAAARNDDTPSLNTTEEDDDGCGMNCIRCVAYSLCCCCLCCLDIIEDDDEEMRSRHNDNGATEYNNNEQDEEEGGGTMSSASPESIHTPLLEGEYGIM